MKGWRALKASTGRFFLKRVKRRKSKVNTIRLDQARNLGIVFDASDEKECRIIQKYVTRLREEGIRKILVIGYFDQKEPPNFLPTQKEFLYFGNADLAWTGKPAGEKLKAFLSEQFDLILDFSGPLAGSLGFVVAWTNSGLKVGGGYNIKNPFLDLMIQIGNEKDTEKLISGMDQYLRNLTPITNE